MKKNLLLYGVFLGALSLSFCSGNAKNKEMTDNGMSMESANEVIRYCDTSLKVLKDLINGDSIKAILGYIDKTEGTDMPLLFHNRLYMKDRAYLKDNYTIANKIRKEELLLSIALSEYKQVIFDILTPTVESAKTVLPSVQKDKK